MQWGDRLFYPSNSSKASRTPALTGSAVQHRAQALRQRIRGTVVRRAPQVMVKVTGGRRGMGAIVAHLRYIAKAGRLPIEDDRGAIREGKDALRAIADQWRFGGTRILEVSQRREAFNIMLSMPVGTEARVLQQAAREFAKAELANHRYVMVLHTHQANPHVHISVRAEGRDGKRINPRKEDLRRWRETFAERLRGWGIQAEASSQVTRGTRHRNERVWKRKTMRPREPHATKAEGLPTGIRKQALRAWAEIMRALAASPEVSDRELAQSINQYLQRVPAVQAIRREQARQRDLPGMRRSLVMPPALQRTGSEIERSVRAATGVLAAGRARGQAAKTAACPRPQAWVRNAPRQGSAGAGLRPPLTRRAAQEHMIRSNRLDATRSIDRDRTNATRRHAGRGARAAERRHWPPVDRWSSGPGLSPG